MIFIYRSPCRDKAAKQDLPKESPKGKGTGKRSPKCAATPRIPAQSPNKKPRGIPKESPTESSPRELRSRPSRQVHSGMQREASMPSGMIMTAGLVA